MILYQYRGNIRDELGFSYLQNLITNGDLRFSKPSEFNDPFDCCPNQLRDILDSIIPHQVGDMINKAIQSTISVLHGIVCLTPHPDRFLMWSHYGDQHRSVCIGYDTQILLENRPLNSEGNPLYENLVKIEYTSKRPQSDNPKFYYQKSEEWAYEEEYRIISCQKKGEPMWGPGVWKIPTSSIKEIVIGARVPNELEQKIVKLVKNTLPNIAVKKAVLHMQDYKLMIEDFEKQPKVDPMSGAVSTPNGKWEDIKS